MDRNAWSILAQKDNIMRQLLDGIAVATKPDLICDIGCFNGEEIARFHRLVPSAFCHAFEANKRNIDQYINTRSDLSDVIVHNLAVADYDGEIEFNILDADGEQEDWRRAAGSLNERTDGVSGQKVRVPCTRLDSHFATQLNANCTFLLWIDVEGALDRVIAGAPRLLRRTIALRAEVERHSFWAGQKLAGETIASMEALGFILLADSFTPDAFAQSDVLFLNKEWLKLAARDEPAPFMMPAAI
jgi:FkbM family methyltransferase